MGHDAITVRHEPGRPLAVVSFTASAPELGARLGPAFGEVFGLLGRRHLTPAGPALGVYAPLGDDAVTGPTFAVHAGCPVAEPVEAEGRVEDFRLPEADVVTTTHRGPYDELPETYEDLRLRALELGQELDPTQMWEEYLTGPEVPPDQQVTVVCWPLRAPAAPTLA